jgi:hypothetical protein
MQNILKQSRLVNFILNLIWGSTKIIVFFVVQK